MKAKLKAKPFLLLLGLLAAPLPAAGQGLEICVENGDAKRYFFTVTLGDTARIGRSLAPGASLCLELPGASPGEPPPGGMVSVFAGEDALEGCSRLVAAGKTETLYRYGEFDLCAWSSNSDRPGASGQ